MICCKPRFDVKKLELYGAIFIFLADFFLLLVAIQEFYEDRKKGAENGANGEEGLLSSRLSRPN